MNWLERFLADCWWMFVAVMIKPTGRVAVRILMLAAAIVLVVWTLFCRGGA